MLQRVDVLELVHEQVAEAPADGGGIGRIALQLGDAVREQIVEVDQAALVLELFVGRVVLGHLGGRERGAPRRGCPRVRRRRQLLGPGPVDLRRHLAHDLRPGRAARAAQHVLHQPAPVGRQLRWTAADVLPPLPGQPVGNAVERPCRHCDAGPQHPQPPHQLPGRAAGERDDEDVAGVGRAIGDAPGDAPREDTRLAAPGRRDDAQRRAVGHHRPPLVRVEVRQQRLHVHPLTVLIAVGRWIARLRPAASLRSRHAVPEGPSQRS